MKWEYLKLNDGHNTVHESVLGRYGEQGWELVCKYGGWLYFKRPKEETITKKPVHTLLAEYSEALSRDSEQAQAILDANKDNEEFLHLAETAKWLFAALHQTDNKIETLTERIESKDIIPHVSIPTLAQTLLSPVAESTLFTMEATFQATGRKEQQILPPYTIGDEEQRLLSARLILEEALETIRGLGFVPSASYDAGCYEPCPDINHFRFGKTDSRWEPEKGQIDFEVEPDLEKIIDGCADTIYVAIRCLTQMGVPDLPHLLEVCKANDAKFPDGKAIIDPKTGKYLKPAGWVAPDHKRIQETFQNAINLKLVAERLVRERQSTNNMKETTKGEKK